jgi:hypothetical protein
MSEIVSSFGTRIRFLTMKLHLLGPEAHEVDENISNGCLGTVRIANNLKVLAQLPVNLLHFFGYGRKRFVVFGIIWEDQVQCDGDKGA